MVRFGQERRASFLRCLSLGLGDDRRSMSGRGDVSLTIFIASVSCGESLTSVTNRFFHFRRPQGFRIAFDAAERNGGLAAFSIREVKRAAAEERERDQCSFADEQ